LPLDPTADTLSLYMVFMSHHIKHLSVMQYLFGIINSLEPHFPNVQNSCCRIIITQTLAGMKKLCGFTGTHQKHMLKEEDLLTLLDRFNSQDLDNLCFISIIFYSFHTLL